MKDAMFIAAAALAYLPLVLSLVLYVRAKRYAYASQVFNDTLRKAGGQVTTLSFLLTLPAVYLLLFDDDMTAQIPWDEKNTALLFPLWLVAYPLTVVIFHALRSGLQKGESFAAPYSVSMNIGSDLLKHGFLAALFFVAIYAGDKNLHPENIMRLKKTVERIWTAT